jgi:hypothetical protein
MDLLLYWYNFDRKYAVAVTGQLALVAVERMSYPR